MNYETNDVVIENVPEPTSSETIPQKTMDIRILNEIFWSLIFGNLANFLLFMIKTDNLALQAIIKLLDGGIFPIICMFIIWSTEGKMRSTFITKSIVYVILPMVLIFGISIAGLDIMQDVGQKGPDCQPQNAVMQFYESLQLEIFYDVKNDPC